MPTTTAARPKATTKRSRPQKGGLDSSRLGFPSRGTSRCDGYGAGKRWAAGAPAKQLRNLLKLEEALGGDEIHDDELAENFVTDDKWDAPTELYMDIAEGGIDDFDRDKRPNRRDKAAAAKFWTAVLGDDAGQISSGEFLRGFFIAGLEAAKARKARHSGTAGAAAAGEPRVNLAAARTRNVGASPHRANKR
jgi:hypothetical protein